VKIGSGGYDTTPEQSNSFMASQLSDAAQKAEVLRFLHEFATKYPDKDNGIQFLAVDALEHISNKLNDNETDFKTAKLTILTLVNRDIIGLISPQKDVFINNVKILYKYGGKYKNLFHRPIHLATYAYFKNKNHLKFLQDTITKHVSGINKDIIDTTKVSDELSLAEAGKTFSVSTFGCQSVGVVMGYINTDPGKYFYFKNVLNMIEYTLNSPPDPLDTVLKNLLTTAGTFSSPSIAQSAAAAASSSNTQPATQPYTETELFKLIQDILMYLTGNYIFPTTGMVKELVKAVIQGTQYANGIAEEVNKSFNDVPVANIGLITQQVSRTGVDSNVLEIRLSNDAINLIAPIARKAAADEIETLISKTFTSFLNNTETSPPDFDAFWNNLFRNPWMTRKYENIEELLLTHDADLEANKWIYYIEYCSLGNTPEGMEIFKKANDRWNTHVDLWKQQAKDAAEAEAKAKQDAIDAAAKATADKLASEQAAAAAEATRIAAAKAASEAKTQEDQRKAKEAAAAAEAAEIEARKAKERERQSQAEAEEAARKQREADAAKANNNLDGKYENETKSTDKGYGFMDRARGAVNYVSGIFVKSKPNNATPTAHTISDSVQPASTAGAPRLVVVNPYYTDRNIGRVLLTLASLDAKQANTMVKVLLANNS